MRREQQHVFDDFIAVAEALVHEGWTNPSHLAASGASNGGLLLAAAANQRPDLFAAVLCDVPLTDMVRFAIYGRGGVPEYGDPQDPDDLAALFAYSPIHNVRKGASYPAMLVSGAEHDERVHPMHPRKLAATLQNQATGGPVLLRMDWDSGHAGADSVKRNANRLAQDYAFALNSMR